MKSRKRGDEDGAAAVGLRVVKKPPAVQRDACFILYLSRETWRGAAGEALADEVRETRAAGLPITMVHSPPDNLDDGCDFSIFFATTPADLIQDGLYTALALALHPPPFRHVSACLIARALGASRLSASGHARTLSGRFHSTSALLQRLTTRKHLCGEATPVAEAQPVRSRVPATAAPSFA